jgi:hypothetical protein
VDYDDEDEGGES